MEVGISDSWPLASNVVSTCPASRFYAQVVLAKKDDGLGASMSPKARLLCVCPWNDSQLSFSEGEVGSMYRVLVPVPISH
jgi:hypothetical protein